MTSTMNIFLLLLKKNFLVRKKHWLKALLIQFAIPILLFMIGQIAGILTFQEAKSMNATFHQSRPSGEIVNELNLQTNVRFTPDTTLTRDLMDRARICMKLPHDKVKGTVDEKQLIDELAEFKSDIHAVLGVVFNGNVTSLGKNFNYKIRIDSELPETFYSPEEDGTFAGSLEKTSILPLQLCLDEAYLKMVLKNDTKLPQINVEQMPYPAYTKIDKWMQIAGNVFLELIRFCFVIILYVEITFIAEEKHIGVNILMAVNGVSNAKNLFSWLVSALIFGLLYLIPMIVILKHLTVSDKAPFLNNGDPFITGLAFFIHLFHLFTFGYHVSAYFWKPTHGLMVIILLVIITNNITGFLQSQALNQLIFYLGIIFPNVLFKGIFGEIATYESKMEGVHWSNLFSTGFPNGQASLGVILIMSIIGIIINFYMTVYIYAVRPGKYGVARHPFFCLRQNENAKEEDSNIDFEGTRLKRKEFEEIPEGSLEPGIRIRGLKKIYTTNWLQRREVKAIDNVSVDFYKSQITALLGHNGAGKTTMMSIISGLTSLSGGVVFIDGEDIKKEPDAIKNNIGLCPQENMVFPDLTVYQHLQFFGTLKAKNTTKKELDDKIKILLSKVNLSDKRNTIPKELSGGQKRRLCLAMAIIGDANVLILDEPTSGMDPESKREVWEIILKMRGEKTIIISTHDMEEADILGDRIAIMQTGRLKCYGTSMFLKKLHGEGQVEVTLSTEPWCDTSNVIRELGIPGELLNRDEGKMVLAVPLEPTLPGALDKLDNMKEELGISGMSVSMITLEQIFLRVTKEDTDEVDSNEPIKYSRKVAGSFYFWQCFSAFFIKKFVFTRKNPWTFAMSILLPCLASCLMFVVDRGTVVVQEEPIIPLTLSAYENPRGFIQSSNPLFREMYINTFKDFGGLTQEIDKTNMTYSLLNEGIENNGIYRTRYITSAEYSAIESIPEITGFYSGMNYLAIPITINTISTTLLRTLANDTNYKIVTSVQKLPSGKESSFFTSASILLEATAISWGIVMFLAAGISLYVTHPLQEARSGIKQLQTMTGASKFAYWGAMLTFDLLQYAISVVILLLGFIIFDSILGTQFFGGSEVLTFIGILMMFGVAMLPLIYLASFLKKTLNSTVTVLSLVPLMLAVLKPTLFIIFNAISDGPVRDFLEKLQDDVFQVIPYMSLFQTEFIFFVRTSGKARCKRLSNANNCSDTSQEMINTLMDSTSQMSEGIRFLIGSSIFFFALMFLIEHPVVGKILRDIVKRIKKWKPMEVNTSEMDEMVVKERETVADEVSRRKMHLVNGELEDSENVFLVHDLKKSYGKLDAVKGISFRVKEGECFGLLGVNGAGKSTTFRMLTGGEIPDDGQMWLKNFSIDVSRSYYLRQMGYCPQQDSIIDTLNARDHLYLFARLRGIPSAEVADVVEKWITKLNLTRCASQPSGTYSGGNKRRLNIAISLIGNPSLVLMDEPTTGVDPAARRSLWNTLKTCQSSGQSFILTSHSMEECETLCNRLVIMVKGQLVCVGASQELKQRFGAGYNIHVKLALNGNNEDTQQIKFRIENKFNCKLMDQNSGFLGYHVTDQTATWTSMYTLMNELKNNYSSIEDFAVLSSTLEQLFIQFARGSNEQSDGDDSDESQWLGETRGSPV
uniref:ABC transporter domain-containing protein n=1 Tax=Bracon brevicornis TaxID=1563983 RepID=A0A6V7M8L4_9HYME